jgi:4-amino-4-deoxy-L-arabinose transferase-like glycosyltransferase
MAASDSSQKTGPDGPRPKLPASLHPGLFVLGWCALVTLVGAAYAVHVGSQLRYVDEQQYYAIAGNVAHHGMFSLDGRTATAFRPPAWPLFLAILRFLGANVVMMRIANVIILAATAYLMYRLLSRVSRPSAGVAAAILCGAYPLLVYTATTLYPQTLAGFLLVLTIWLWTRPGPRSWARMAVIGAVAGVLILTVSTFAYLVLLLPLLQLGRSRPSLREYLRSTACVLLGAALIIIPWTIRNETQFGHVFFVSSNQGYNLLLGNSPHAGADTGVSSNISQYGTHASAIQNEVARDNYYRDQALSWIGHHPEQAAWLYVEKLGNFFSSANRLATEGEGSPAQGALLTLAYGVLVVLTVARILWRRRLPLTGLDRWCLLAYGVGAVLSAVFFTRVRFRGPYDLLLIVVAAPVLAELASRLGNRVRRSQILSAS